MKQEIIENKSKDSVMKHSLPLGCRQEARSPKPCLGAATQTRKTGQEGATYWDLGPKFICCEVSA